MSEPRARAEVGTGATARRGFVAVAGRRRSTGRELFAALRPRQWAKNVLVLAAPGAAGVLASWPQAGQVAACFGCLCMAASGAYLLNDVHDAPLDRRHPRKRHRPIAAGTIPATLAVGAGVALMASAIALGALVRWELAAVLAGYVGLSLAYSYGLRQVAVLDIATVAGLWLLRAIAGGAATGVPLSSWFLVVAGFGSLFVVTTKRSGELDEAAAAGITTRTTLAAYPVEYLRQIRTVSAAVTLAAYCDWAFAEADPGAAVPFAELSVIPVVLFMLRYALLAERQGGGAPEELILGDRALLAIAVLWVAMFGAGVVVSG